jgi:hypothetical protein
MMLNPAGNLDILKTKTARQLLELTVDYATFGMKSEMQQIINLQIPEFDWDSILDVCVQYKRPNIAMMIIDVVSRRHIVRTIRRLAIDVVQSKRFNDDKDRTASNKNILRLCLAKVDVLKILQYIKMTTDIKDPVFQLAPYFQGQQFKDVLKLNQLDTKYDLV